jgi:choline dehydrogenase-like flavoprotein
VRAALDNLYVADTSFFPSIGAVNPALTAIANGIRVGEHLAKRLGAGSVAWAPAQRIAPSARTGAWLSPMTARVAAGPPAGHGAT